MIIINDTHAGVTRQAGTTPASQSALREYVINELEALVERAITCDEDLTLNGDLFDGFTVDTRDLIAVYNILAQYLNRTPRMLTLIMGNHDASAKGDKVSSFHLLCHILQSQFEDRVRVIDHTRGLTYVDIGVWAIPHMMNQDLFNMEIEKALAVDNPGYLLLHANCMSPFAEHSDHSLNVSEDQLDPLVAKGWTLVFAHEHQPAQYRGGKVIVVGNQIPTSVSDCLGPEHKQYLRVTQEGHELVEWMKVASVFRTVDWTNLDADLTGVKFLRVTGDCTASQASDMVSAIAKLRQRHDAFVITNAVKIEGVAQMDSLAEMSVEAISRFDVTAALMEHLDEREQAVVKGLLS